MKIPSPVSISSTDLCKSPMPLSQTPNHGRVVICLESTARLRRRAAPGRGQTEEPGKGCLHTGFQPQGNLAS